MSFAPSLVHALNVSIPLLTKGSEAVKRRRGYPIHAFVGANGSGKSLLAAEATLPTLRGVPWSCSNEDHLHTAHGITSGLRRVVSTMRFTTPSGADHPLWEPLTDWLQIINAEHCDLILDEVGGAVASSTSDDIPMPVKAALQELRRREVVCRWTAPSWARASKVLRECSQAVTLVMGYMPVPHTGGIAFDGPHALELVSEDGETLVDGGCELGGPHEHDTGRVWGARRLMYARTFDATVFDEWTTAKRENIKPEIRQLFWRPGSEAERAYDTHAYVEKLGQVTDGGRCMTCGGVRTRAKCSCGPSVHERRQSVRAGTGAPHVHGADAVADSL